MKIVFLLLLTTLLMSGCTSGGSTRSESISVGSQYYPTTNYVELFFGAYNGNKQYEQISFIEVLGGKRSKTDELLKELRRKAKSVGADAVIDIRKGRRIRKENDSALLVLSIAAGEDSSHTSQEYRSDTLQGIAIKYLD
mgnify:FL=1|tara:strand:- start:10344 stop:10760 length:417 start_codon:yes stop_codon:yes gene_type:complete